MIAETRTKSSLAEGFDHVLAATVDACRAHYGRRLSALAVFGSVGRGTASPNSDIDLLLVVDPLPDGRVARMADFQVVERTVAEAIQRARGLGVATELSPVLKTPREIAHGSPLLLDMTDDARILHDPDGALVQALDALRRRLTALGARRIWRGNAWYWDLKPDYRPGEVFEL